MAGNSVALEFAGDATKLQKAAKQATEATDQVAKAAKDAGADFDKAAKESANFEDRIGKLGAGITGMTDALETAGGSLQAIADVQDYGREKASRLARAANDVKQAYEDQEQAARDLAQSTIDLEQSAIDLEQAQLDEATALKDYNQAVKEHGANSDEAKQAKLDMAQASLDVLQAEEDAAQATRDASQANIDAEAAQLDLNDAMHEANPPQLQEWADKLNLITPLLTAVVGVTGLVTAAQWAWNAAQLASPLTWILLAIGAVIAIIVVIATKTDWFQKAWRNSWKWIKDSTKNVIDWFKKIPGWTADIFGKVAGFISKPYRMAFNLISDAWNNTIGRLSWTVPGWIPGIGGNTIQVPNLPRFHTGVDRVPGAPGSEMLAVLQAGETVTSAGGGSDSVTVVVKLDREVLLNAVARGVGRRGGRVQFVLGGVNA